MSPPPAASRRIGDVLRIAVAVIGFTAGLAGVPIVLWWAAGTLHYPTDVEWFHLDHNVQAPSVDEQLRTWLYHTYHALRLSLGIDGFIVLAVLALAGLAWLKFVWLTLVELVLLARDGTELLLERAQQVGLRGWIASLLTTLALSTPANAAHVATAAPTTAATAPPQPATPDHSDDTDPTSAATTLGGHDDPPPTSPTTHLPDELRPDCPRYRVHAGDSLIRIAAQHLGDAARWRDLAALNQPWLPNPNQLTPGWQLLLPPDVPAPEQPEVTEITISYGDTLASLAEAHLHDPERLGELFDLNAGRTQPDGLQLADPNILLAGWTLLVPLEHEPQQSGDAPRVAPPDAPSVTEHETGAPAPAPATAEDGGFSLGHGVFLGVGLAAAISLALAQARARHRRHQHPDNDLSDLPVAPTVSALRFAHLRATTEPDTATARSTQILGGSEPVGTTEHGTQQGITGACRGLVVELGTRHEATVTLDLATCGGLGLSGPAQEHVAHALLLHLLSRHSTHTGPPAQIVLTRPEADWLLPTDETPETVRIVDDLASALELLEHTQSEPDHPARAASVVIARTPVEHAHRLRNLLRSPTASALGAVLLGPWPDGTTVITDREAHVVHTQPDSAVELDGTRLFTATPHASRALLPLTPTPRTPSPSSEPAAATPAASTTAQEPDTPINEQEPTACATSDAEQHRCPTEAPLSAAPITLRLFGPVTVDFTDQHGSTHDLTSSLSTRQRDLVVYLALHPDGISRDTLITDLWHEPGRHRPTNAFNTLLSRLRGTVSRATAGAIEDLVDTTGTGRYRLSPRVTTDYATFLQHAATSHRTHDTDPELGPLDEIVGLYTGSLAADIDTEWIQAPRQHAQRTFINAVSTLANHRVHQHPHQTRA